MTTSSIPQGPQGVAEQAPAEGGSSQGFAPGVAQERQQQLGTPLDREAAIARLDALGAAVGDFYWRLFRLGTGAHFHAFVEWCGVMKEHLNICRSLIEAGHDPFGDNIHTGQPLPIPPYQLAYLAEKIDCIFGGLLTVSAADGVGLRGPTSTTDPDAVPGTTP